MRAIILIVLLGSVITFVTSCDLLFPDEKLSLQRVNYNGNELRTDGYYYHFTSSNNTIVYFLYRNGIILCAHSYSSHDLTSVELEMVKIYSEIRKLKDSWGVFIVNDNKIEYDMWNTPTGFSFPITKSKGYIENDTTFHITETYYSDINKTYYEDELWHFRQFANKPDSTNNFIK